MANASHRAAGVIETEARAPASAACPVCGGLECLCRPRFFAGQLLTEEDLTRLDRYMVSKNKLHNRYLHGWGVVCGLEVVCHACPGFVTIRTGYAIDPCGEDIVVCRDQSINVCEMINECRSERPEWDCDPPQRAADPACQDVVDEWVLAICYRETQSRKPVLTHAAGACTCAHSNGKSSRGGCGCGCQGNDQPSRAKTARTPSSPRTTALSCEPTVVCEGFGFKVYKKPPVISRRLPATLRSDFARRLAECESYLNDLLTPVPAQASVEQLHAWCCDLKVKLRDFFAEHPTHDCTLFDRLARIVCPPTSQFRDPIAYRGALAPVVAQLGSLVGEYRRYCRCAVQLPPCPDPVESNCVPLATITVKRQGCQIQRVCNWGVRRIVLSFPLLDYWLGPLGGLQHFAGFEAECCRPFSPKVVKLPPREPGRVAVSPRVTIRMSAAPPSETPHSALLSHSWSRRGRLPDEEALALAALGASDENDQAFASDLDTENAVELLVIDRFLRPVAEALLPEELIEQIEAAISGSAAAPAGAGRGGESEVVALRRTVAELQRAVVSQGEAIKKLTESRR